MPRFKRSALAALVLCAMSVSTSLSAATEVVTSIKPVELLVRAVAGDTAEVTTLVPAGSSPHTYNMRPSQRRALESAEVIFWIGPDMESFLSRLLAGSDFRDRTVMLMNGDHEESGHHGDSEQTGNGAEHSEHDHGDGEDPHIWLDPALALDMARKIRDALAGLEEANPEILNENLAEFEAKLAITDNDIRTKLAPAREIGLFAYHSAFVRFAEHYELPLVAVLTLNPELSPGARHISEVQEKLRRASHPCLLTEPQFNRQWWRTITRDLDVTFSTWDPLATDIAATEHGYQALLQGIGDAVLRCLPENPEH